MDAVVVASVSPLLACVACCSLKSEDTSPFEEGIAHTLRRPRWGTVQFQRSSVATDPTGRVRLEALCRRNAVRALCSA